MLLLVGGPARVGKSALGQLILERHHIPWLSTDIIRTVLTRIDSTIEPADRSGDPDALATAMLPYLNTLTAVCLAVHPTYLIEGVELTPETVLTLKQTTKTTVRACFLTHPTYTRHDLTNYRGHNPWHEPELDPDHYESSAAKIRSTSIALDQTLKDNPKTFWTSIDVSKDFDAALDRACRFLIQN